MGCLWYPVIGFIGLVVVSIVVSGGFALALYIDSVAPLFWPIIGFLAFCTMFGACIYHGWKT